jgi:hypothetical protein
MNLMLFPVLLWLCLQGGSASISDRFLPSIEVEVERHPSMAVGTVILRNIPKLLYDKGEVSVRLWYCFNNSADCSEVDRYHDIPLNSSYVRETQPHILGVEIKFNHIEALSEDKHVLFVLQLYETALPLERTIPRCFTSALCAKVTLLASRPVHWMSYQQFRGRNVYPGTETFVDGLVTHVDSSLSLAQKNDISLPYEVLTRRGFSGISFRHFINYIGSMSSVRYLEVGVFYGSTLLSILHGNRLRAVAIDSWSDPQLGANAAAKAAVLFSVREAGREDDVDIIDDDCFRLVATEAGRSRIVNFLNGSANVYFYDAGHTVLDHFMALSNFYPVLDDVFVFIVDDWNFPGVRKGSLAAIVSLEFNILYAYEMTTAGNLGEETTFWHNGCGIFVLQKP